MLKTKIMDKAAALLEEAHELLTDEHSRADEAWGEKSERWQDGEKGQSARNQIDRLEQLCGDIENALAEAQGLTTGD